VQLACIAYCICLAQLACIHHDLHVCVRTFMTARLKNSHYYCKHNINRWLLSHAYRVRVWVYSAGHIFHYHRPCLVVLHSKVTIPVPMCPVEQISIICSFHIYVNRHDDISMCNYNVIFAGNATTRTQCLRLTKSNRTRENIMTWSCHRHRPRQQGVKQQKFRYI
jgi:hypothetical protein